MTIKELSIQLEKQGIRKDAYSLTGGLPSEAYCLNPQRNYWEVYYSERGQKSGLQVFDSEKAACRAFMDLIMSDESIMDCK